ncbi:MAG: ATP-binding protein [Deltaproteobacteria bacterium]|nr:ATP-binding protein [Deltaproteobacteria bacterium]
MARLDGKDRLAAAGEVASDAGRVIRDLAGPLLSRRGSSLREDLLSRALLLAFLSSLVLLVLDLRNASASITLAAPPALLAPVFLLADGAAWREWRGRASGRAHLLLGALGGLAALTLARGWAGGEPGRFWLLAAFLAPSALIEATRITLHGEAAHRRVLERSLLLFGLPGVLFAVLPLLVPRASLPLRDALIACALAALALGAGAVLSLACLREGRPIDVRQRGKLVAAGHSAALLSLIAAAFLRAQGENAAAGIALLGLAVAPAALVTAALRENLLWVDRFLRWAFALVLTVPLALLLGWSALRVGGAAGIALTACMILAAPAAAARLGDLFEQIFHRSWRRRTRALATLEDRLAQGRTLEEIAGSARAVCGEAFPGVTVAVLAADPETGSLREIAPEDDPSSPRDLGLEHSLAVHLRAATSPLTRYDVLSAPRYSHARGAWLKDLDEVRAAALLPCRDGEGLQGVLVLGGQVRGGFFTEDEIAVASSAATALAPALSRATALEGARRTITRLEARLDAARAQTGQAEADGSQAMEDLEESTRHVMTAYAELKVREDEAREVRARLAASAKVLLAGRLAERMVNPVEGALAEADRKRAAKSRRGAADVHRARLGLGAIAAITRRDPAMPCDLPGVLEAVLAVLEDGWRGRIKVERKITETPAVAWPSEALHAALLAILLNADEAVARRGTISIEARGVEGRVVTVADAEDGHGESVAPSGQAAGKIAWMTGAPRVQVVITDDGCGIPVGLQERLFHPFFTTKPRGSGALGLGLSIVADALAHHGGSIRVESDPGQGTRLVLELPGALPPVRARASRRSS